MEKGNFFVNRPIVAMVIAIITVIVGVVSLLSLPMEQYPDITPPQVEVRASYTGANAIKGKKTFPPPQRAGDEWCGEHDLYEIYQLQ